MGSRITTIEKAQDTVLAQFNVDKHRKNTFLEEQIKLSKIKNADFELNRKIKKKEDFYKLNTDIKERLEKDKEYQKLIKEKELRTNINNYGDVTEAVKKLFGLFSLLYFTTETITELNIKDVDFYEDENVSLNFVTFKCYKNKLMVKLKITYIKEVFVKGDDFETTKAVIKVPKEIIEELNVEASYGDYSEFRRKLLSSLKETSFDVFKVKKEKEIIKDNWNFDSYL